MVNAPRLLRKRAPVDPSLGQLAGLLPFTFVNYDSLDEFSKSPKRFLSAFSDQPLKFSLTGYPAFFKESSSST